MSLNKIHSLPVSIATKKAKKWGIIAILSPLSFVIVGIFVAIVIISQDGGNFGSALLGISFVGCSAVVSYFILPIIFGIRSITYYNKAKRECADSPMLFAPPNSKIKYLGIIGIAIPFMPAIVLYASLPFHIVLTEKNKNKDDIAIQNMYKSIDLFSNEYDKLSKQGLEYNDIDEKLASFATEINKKFSNPHDEKIPSCIYGGVAGSYYYDNVKDAAARKAGSYGYVGTVYVYLSHPVENFPKYIGAAVQTEVMRDMNGTNTVRTSKQLDGLQSP